MSYVGDTLTSAIKKVHYLVFLLWGLFGGTMAVVYPESLAFYG